jgi:cytochrome c553
VSEHPPPDDKGWTLWASLAVAGFLAFSLLMGLVVLPMAQAPNANLDAWTAICRAIGLQPGTPAQRQPVSTAVAAPVSRVQWSPRTLKILASADPRPGAQAASAVCSACHGEEGMSMTAQFPRLAGQSPEAIYNQLSDYRSGARFNAQMTPVAQGLSEEQLAEVAAYFGHIKSGPALGLGQKTVDDEAIRRLIFRGDPARRIPPCEGCHARGVGGPPEAPVIAGQTAAYVERQLLAYRSGERRNDVYRRMRDIAERLTPAEIKALSTAYQGTY